MYIYIVSRPGGKASPQLMKLLKKSWCPMQNPNVDKKLILILNLERHFSALELIPGHEIRSSHQMLVKYANECVVRFAKKQQ